MYVEASDHACPHLRQALPAETMPARAEPTPSPGCPFSAARAAAEPARLAATAASGGGWWAFKAEALAMTAQL